jgi:hypothetical protein
MKRDGVSLIVSVRAFVRRGLSIPSATAAHVSCSPKTVAKLKTKPVLTMRSTASALLAPKVDFSRVHICFPTPRTDIVMPNQILRGS